MMNMENKQRINLTFQVRMVISKVLSYRLEKSQLLVSCDYIIFNIGINLNLLFIKIMLVNEFSRILETVF